MKMRSYLFLLLLFAQVSTYSQTHKSTRVEAGEDIAQAYSRSGFYRFPVFSRATVYMKNGTLTTEQLFNYNMLSGKLQFINKAGDTMDISNPALIDSVFFEKTFFCYNNGFMEMVAATDSVRLFKKNIIKFSYENIGGYGTASPTSAISNINTFTTSSNVYNLRLNQNIVLDETIYWYWMDNRHNLAKATRSNLLSLLPPTQKAPVEAYLKKEKINLEKEKDLMQLMNMLQSIQ
jgi:hypothetical protein